MAQKATQEAKKSANKSSDGLDISDLLNMVIVGEPGSARTYQTVAAPLMFADCNMKGYKILAMIAMEAPKSIICRSFARLCELESMIDETHAAVVEISSRSTVEVLGRVKDCSVEIGGVTIKTSLLVADTDMQGCQMIMGHDILAGGRMLLDWGSNTLIVGKKKSIVKLQLKYEAPVPNGYHNPEEKDIKELVKLGFSRNKAREGLIKFWGNKQMAAVDLKEEVIENVGRYVQVSGN